MAEREKENMGVKSAAGIQGQFHLNSKRKEKRANSKRRRQKSREEIRIG